MRKFSKKLSKILRESVVREDAAAHWNEMRVDQRQSDAKAMGWDESAGDLKWDELTKEQQAAYMKHYKEEQ